MAEFDLSVISFDHGLDRLRALLAEFENEHNVRVNIQSLNWTNAWAEIIKFALYGHSPAVSEVGSTWVANLAAMNVLRPFKPHEMAGLGGRRAFLNGVWRAGALDESLWAAPWLAETRLIYYRRDLLQAAGVDEVNAFADAARFEDTLIRLKASGVAIPWAVPTLPTLNTFHHVASWVWGAGGQFVSDDGTRVEFDRPPARAGLRNYYNLHRFLPPEAAQWDDARVEALFAEGRAAATISGPWLLHGPDYAPGVPAELRVAPTPGVPVVSGSHLVVWRNMPPEQERLALELVRFLTGKRAQITASQIAGLLPALRDALAAEPFSVDPIYQVMGRGALIGRGFKPMRLWGLVEDKLTVALANLWAKILATPDPNVDALIRAELDPLAAKLNALLENK